MSLLLTGCHYYGASGVSSIPSSTTRIAVASWVWVPSSITDPGLSWRALVSVSGSPENTTQEFVAALASDGLYVPSSRVQVGGVTASSSGSATMYDGAHTGRWMLIAAIYDRPASAADAWCVYGRPSATAIPATETAKSGDLSALAADLDRIYVGRDIRWMASAATTNDTTSAIEIGETAIWVGSIPTLTQWQEMVDGVSPDAYSPFEHWRFRDGSDGLVGRIAGITLAPLGGSATAAYNATRNPTVADPEGGGSSAIRASAASRAVATAALATSIRLAAVAAARAAATAGFSVPASGLNFNTSDFEFGQRTGLGVADFSVYASSPLNVAVYADTDVLLTTKLFSFTASTGANGRLARQDNALLVAGTWYFFVARNSDGTLSGCGRIQAVA